MRLSLPKTACRKTRVPNLLEIIKQLKERGCAFVCSIANWCMALLTSVDYEAPLHHTSSNSWDQR